MTQSAGVAEGTPVAPGRLGEAIPQRELFEYLAALTRWLGDLGTATLPAAVYGR